MLLALNMKGIHILVNCQALVQVQSSPVQVEGLRVLRPSKTMYNFFGTPCRTQVFEENQNHTSKTF